MAKNDVNTSVLNNIEPYSILSDLMHNIIFVILGTLAAGMIASIVSFASAQKTYSTNAIFAITAGDSTSYAYSNLNAASEMASTFSRILQSDIMVTTVQEDLGLESMNAKMSASQVPNTNLLNISVSADTPQEAYIVIKSVMENYDSLTKYANSSMVMHVLKEPAVPSRKRLSDYSLMNQKRIMLLVFAGLCAVFVAMSVKNDTVKSEQDFTDKLDTKRLGTVKHMGGGIRNMLKKNKQPLLVTDPLCSFEFTEKFRKIAANITNQADKKGAKVIMITSTAEHEGKSTVSANIALTIAKTGKSVLLIDGDLRRPTIGKMFGLTVEPKHSLPNLAKGEVALMDCLQAEEKTKLFILPSREKGFKNSTELMSSARMGHLIKYLKDRVDYIILDTPPMGVMADAEAAAQYADMSVLVVKYDLVQASAINDSIDILEGAPAEYIGAILNDLKALPGQDTVTTGYGYGMYGKYGKYGAYGKYGNYSHYADRNKQKKSAGEGNA